MNYILCIHGVSHLILFIVGLFYSVIFNVFSHFMVGVPRLLFSLIPASITSFSFPRSCLTTCPKFLKTACVILDSSLHSGLMYSSTQTLVFFSIQDTVITLLQDHISNASTFFLSGFLIVNVFASYSWIVTTEHTV